MTTPRPRLWNCDEQPVVPPPSTATVDYTPRPILYLASGQPLVRPVGYKP